MPALMGAALTSGMYEQITTNEDADAFIEAPDAVWILKHSLTCPVSAWAMQEFISYLKSHPQEKAAVVVVQHARNVYNHIAQKLGVKHESPQLFLVQEERVLWHGSHGAVSAANMKQARSSAVQY